MNKPDAIAAAEPPLECVVRPCTCHHSDNPPRPCAQQYALKDCKRVDLGRYAGTYGGYLIEEPKRTVWQRVLAMLGIGPNVELTGGALAPSSDRRERG
jgi:hypothetical protein